MKKSLKRLAPEFSLRILNKMGLYSQFKPAVGRVHLGDLKSRSPFSDSFGFDRGTPIDRYYIENFLAKEAGSIRGRVLEIGDNEYTLRFGGKNITQSEILHINDSNPSATIIGDLSDAPQIPDNSFDCIILTQTLHLVYHYHNVLKTCARILKPGGALLLTVPGITPVDIDEWEFLYSFTKRSVKLMLAEDFSVENTQITCYGNVLVASAFLYGMSLSELKKEELDHNDERFQVIIAAKAVKALKHES